MSIRTLRKRIALVAVSALGAGMLSVMAIPSANAAAADGGIDSTAGTIGLVGAITPTLAEHDNSTTRTAVLLSTGTLVVSLADDGAVVVSAGARITASTTAADINASQTCAAIGGADTASITPTGAAGTTFTVTTYAEDTCAAAATIRDVITVTIAASNLSGTPSASDSSVRWDSNNSGDAPTAAEDVTNSSTTYGNTLKLRMNVKDVYGQDISLTTGSLVVTLTGSNGYLGAIAGTGAAVAATAAATTVVSNADPSPLWVVVSEATVGGGWSGTVTVTYNGVVLATKSGRITGAPASISVTPYKIGRTGGTSGVNNLLYTVKDAAGNLLSFTNSDLALDTSSNSAIVSGIAAGSVEATSTSAYGPYVGSLKTICAGTAGVPNSVGNSADLVLKYTLSNGTVIKSNKFATSCAGDAYEYSASFDKASYVQGEIATLVIQFMDAAGKPANSTTAVASLNDAGDAGSTNATISAPMMTMVGSMGDGTLQKPNLLGQLKYTFTVGTASGLTAGAYNAVVYFPDIDVATSVAYSVSTGAAVGVSNAEVLAAIVKLIASINKQIKALQKSLKK